VSEAITSWRIASPGLTWKANDLSGNGSALYPGRWNSQGRPLVYSSSSIALACLETVVHLAADDPLPFQRQLVRITIPSQHWRQRTTVGKADLSGWSLLPTPENPEDWLAGAPQAGPPWQQPLGGAVALEMVPIPAGEFRMGSPEDEEGRADDEGPQHRVRLAPFSLARTPITQAQWRQVARWQPAPGEPPWERELDPEPSLFKSDLPEAERRPVECVSWFDAQEFCRRLSQRTGRTYTLPSEAQWEYACRAGTTTPYAFGTTLSQRQANVSTSATTAVARYPANAWGLHDLHGNVWEWCNDHWHPNYRGAPDDGRSWIDPSADMFRPRLLRGGSWFGNPGSCRSASRFHSRPGFAVDTVGLRVVCLPQGPSLNS
jgi:formylglycine-generating enzyme required for sulfatase activity